MKTMMPRSGIALVMIGWLLVGCQKKPVPPPAPPHAPPPKVAADEDAARDEPEPMPTAAHEQPVQPSEPTVPDGALAGVLDGRAFVLDSATRDGGTLTFRSRSRDAISIVMFEEPTDRLELLEGDVPFGSPHVYVRAAGAEAMQVYPDGYRMILDVHAGELWLELPEGRGTIGGHFVIERGGGG